jgi:uncharacterized repeat protein (TIGR03803 family)
VFANSDGELRGCSAPRDGALWPFATNNEDAAMSRAARYGFLASLATAMLLSFGLAGRAATLVSLYSFCTAMDHSVCLDGEAPWSRLLQIGARFYGTSSAIDAADAGTVFRVTTKGAFKTLHTFCTEASCSGGAAPGKYLALGSDGEVYGVTTTRGGAGDGGTIFKMSTAGRLTTIYRFCSEARCLDGSSPVAITFDAKGNIFGTATAGGKYREGTLFEITTKRAYLKLYDFCSYTNCADGLAPGALLLGSDGNFYGTTAAGGENQAGTVFVVTPVGDLTTLYSFCARKKCADGEQPNQVLVQGRDGNLYGTTTLGGGNGAGTIFRLTRSGSLRTLYAFCDQSYCDDGGNPTDGLIAAADGSFYGAAAAAGIYYNGVLFNITSTGRYSIVYDFCATGGCFDGASPSIAPTLAKDGNLYGTTLAGGDKFNVGTVYKLTP